MASGFRIVYPMEAFDGGLNNKYEPNIVLDNESPDCKNVVFDDRGGVQTRQGCSQLNTAAVGSFAGDGLFTYRQNSGTEVMVGWWDGTPYKLTGTSFITIASGQGVFTAASRVDMSQYQNLAFFGDDEAKPYKYNGTEFTRHGIPQPNSGPTAASGTAAASRPPTGDINYKVSYVNSYSVEGDVSAATTTLTLASSASVNLTGIPLAPTSFGVNARKLYRLDSGSGGSYKLVTTISDNTTATYTDTTVSASLGAAAPTDQGEPPNWGFSVTHQERLWLIDAANPQYLWYSELGNPFVVKVTNYILISDGDGERITGLWVHDNMIAIGKESSVWLIYMPDTTPGNWIRIKSKSKYGPVGHWAKAEYSGRTMYLGKRYSQIAGFLALTGDSTEPNSVDLSAVGVTSDTKSDAIEPDVFLFTNSALPKAIGIEFKNKLWFSVPYNGTTTNNRVYQFDFQRRNEAENKGSWVPFTHPYSWSAFTIYDGKLYAQCQTANGLVMRLDHNDYSDNGTAIDSYFWTKEFHGRDEDIEHWKDFRFAHLIVETLGSYYMNVVYKTDADSGAGTTVQVDLTPGGSNWGAFNWGSGTWGSGAVRRKSRVDLGGKQGKRIQFKFSNQNTLNQGFHVYPQDSFQYNRRGLR